MTGIQDDLATLRKDHIDNGIALGYIDNANCKPSCVVCAALARVEDEIARLTDAENERREGMVVAYDYSGEYVGCIGEQTWRWLIEHPAIDASWLERAEGAEAEIARLTDEQLVKYERGDDFHHDFWKERAEAAEADVAQLEQERDDAVSEEQQKTLTAWQKEYLRAERAEAEVARLRDGLREIAEADFGAMGKPGAKSMARALLAEDGAATAADGGPKWTVVWDEFEGGAP